MNHYPLQFFVFKDGKFFVAREKPSVLHRRADLLNSEAQRRQLIDGCSQTDSASVKDVEVQSDTAYSDVEMAVQDHNEAESQASIDSMVAEPVAEKPPPAAEPPVAEPAVTKQVETTPPVAQPVEEPNIVAVENIEIGGAIPPKLERTKSRDDIVFQSGWRKRVRLADIIRAKLIGEKRIIEMETEAVSEDEVAKELSRYLIGDYPIAGVYNDRTGQKMSLHQAFKEKIISRGTALSLLEAQAAVGSIIDPVSGDKMSVDDALQRDLLDRSFAAVLARAERAVHGYQYKGTTEVLSLFQAMKRGFIVESHGVRLLEAQIATGGIIDPVANHRLPVEVAFERGLFDERLNKILEDPSDDTKGFLDPNTKENLTYLELIDRCVEDVDTHLLLLPLVKEEETQLYKDRELSKEVLQSRIGSSSEA